MVEAGWVSGVNELDCGKRMQEHTNNSLQMVVCSRMIIM
jgi:hypothetical protein